MGGSFGVASTESIAVFDLANASEGADQAATNTNIEAAIGVPTATGDIVIIDAGTAQGNWIKNNSSNWRRLTANTTLSRVTDVSVYADVAASAAATGFDEGDIFIILDSTDLALLTDMGSIPAAVQLGVDAPVTVIWDGAAWQLLGSPASSNNLTTLTRKTVSVNQIIPGATDAQFTLSMGKVYQIIQITSNQPVWLRFYQTIADRTADSARLITEDPANDAGVVAEYVFGSAGVILANPIPTGSQTTANVPIAIRNTDPTPALTQVDIEYIEVES